MTVATRLLALGRMADSRMDTYHSYLFYREAFKRVVNCRSLTVAEEEVKTVYSEVMQAYLKAEREAKADGHLT